jgi:hypothetical protein
VAARIEEERAHVVATKVLLEHHGLFRRDDVVQHGADDEDGEAGVVQVP